MIDMISQIIVFIHFRDNLMLKILRIKDKSGFEDINIYYN